MPGQAEPRRESLSEAHRLLGAELRRIRLTAGKTTRSLDGYSSGHISNVENGYVTPSRELLQAYLAQGGDAPRVMALYTAMKHDGELRARERRQRQHPTSINESQPGPGSPFEVIRAAYQVAYSEDYCAVDERGVVTTVHSLFGIRARKSEVSYVTRSMGYGADPRRGVVSVEAGVGCQIARMAEYDNGVIDTVFKLSQPAKASDLEATTFSFTVRTHTDKPVNPYLRFHTQEVQERHALRVEFSSTAAPTSVWWFRGKHHFDVDMGEKHLLEPNSAQFYFHDFLDLHDEYWGIGWQSA